WVTCREYVGEQWKRFVGAGSVAHQFVVRSIFVVVVETMMPLVDDHDLGQVGREAQPLFGIRGATATGIFESEEPAEVVECRALAQPLVVVNVRNPFGELLLR